MAGIPQSAVRSATRAFRAPQNIDELLRLERAIDELRAAGNPTDELESAIASVRGMFDPESVAISRILSDMERGPQYSVPEVTLRGLDVPAAPGRLDDMDMPTLQAINKANNSYQGLQSGRTLNLRNQNTPLNQIRRDDILTAAEEAIQGQQEALAAERLMQAAGGAGAMGLGAMIAETANRSLSPGVGPSVARAPEPEYLQAVPEYMPPDVSVDMPEAPDPVDPYTYSDELPEDAAFTTDDSLATADLVEEARPVPASTPRVETLTPEEIAALRSQVVSIRDAQTGQAMDSFYPPESEEYKQEQRMRQRYPQLRMR